MEAGWTRSIHRRDTEARKHRSKKEVHVAAACDWRGKWSDWISHI